MQWHTLIEAHQIKTTFSKHISDRIDPDLSVHLQSDLNLCCFRVKIHVLDAEECINETVAVEIDLNLYIWHFAYFITQICLALPSILKSSLMLKRK